jgi:hypothetical protein
MSLGLMRKKSDNSIKVCKLVFELNWRIHDPMDWLDRMDDFASWIRANCSGEWWLSPSMVAFEKENDALLFKLTWFE